MDFFEAQQHARRRTSRLIALFVLAVLGTIGLSYAAAMALINFQRARTGTMIEELGWFDPQVLAGVAAGTLAIVGLASLYKWASFRSGGGAVAESVGGRRVSPDTTDLAERRLLNVVEEMAIASGIPVPAVYVLADEGGLNAFAAGLTSSDAIVAVTRGTMEKLSRDELQGVVAHEFSHILNGDMRINVRIAAIVFGILVIGLIGRGILRGLGRGRVRTSGKGGGGAVLVVVAAGVAFLIIGYLGYFFGRLIQAAVSRQREFLADASAVQFTRNPGGIAGALRKIGGYALGSELAAPKAAEIGHFFFAQGFHADLFGSLWATHPPLDVRIRAIDPQWDGTYFQPAEVVDVSRQSFVDAGLTKPHPEVFGRIFAPAGAGAVPPKLTAMSALAAVAAVGTVTSRHVDYARDLIDHLPPRLLAAARSPDEARALIFALLLGPGLEPRDQAAAVLAAQAGADAVDRVHALRPAFAQLAVDARLPLAQLALPVLRQLPPADRAAFAAACQALIEADRQLTFFEYAVQKVVLRHLRLADAPTVVPVQLYSFNAVAEPIAVLLSALAWAGAVQGAEQADGTAEADAAAAAAAFRDGAAELKLIESRLALLPPGACDFPRLDAALDRLAGSSFPIKQRLLLASAHTVSHDGVIRPEESELLRAFADTLGCPMPPLLGELAA